MQRFQGPHSSAITTGSAQTGFNQTLARLDGAVFVLLAAALVVGRLVNGSSPNFTPLSACCLFAGYWFAGLRGRVFSLPAVLVPVVGMLVSNLFLPRHASVWVVAAVLVSSVLNVVLSALATRTIRSKSLAGAFCLVPSLQFFLLTNGAVWLVQQETYERSFAGLVACYIAALPFLRNMYFGDLLYIPGLFFAAWCARLLSDKALSPAKSYYSDAS